MISCLAIARRQFWEKIVKVADEAELKESVWIHKCLIVEKVIHIFLSVYKAKHSPPSKCQPSSLIQKKTAIYTFSLEIEINLEYSSGRNHRQAQCCCFF